MLVNFTSANGSPIYLNPRYIIAICEEKHFGRPGVGTSDGYVDTLVMTTKGDFNVQETLADAALAVNAALEQGQPGAGTPQGTA
jgi:hypothetical protein